MVISEGPSAMVSISPAHAKGTSVCIDGRYKSLIDLGYSEYYLTTKIEQETLAAIFWSMLTLSAESWDLVAIGQMSRS